MILKIQTSGNWKLWTTFFILLSLIFNGSANVQKPNQETDTLTIFHFNDVYELAPTSSEPKQGAAYFKALLDRYKLSKQGGNISDHTLTFFSGDVFSPSLLSSQYGGWNMIKPLNSFGIDAACYGNHEFDYSIESIKKLVNATNFPWVFSNVFDKKTGRRLVQAEEYVIFNKLNYKIGVFALTEQQWIHTIIPQYIDRCQIRPFIDFGKLMVNKLRNQLGCDFIIVLTHMMRHNDIILAENVQGIDLILGGHDHTVMHQKVNDIVIVKSGSDFQHFTKIQIKRINRQKQQQKPVALSGQKIQEFRTKKYDIRCTLVQVNHELMKIIPDPEIHDYVNKLVEEFNIKKQRIVLYIANDIDLRSNTIRANQSPYLNFIAQLYRWDRGADCTLINSGAFRQGKIMPKGPVTLGTFMNFIADDIRVKNVTGKQIIWLLQNSISLLPSFSGRYFQLAGIEFVWDDSKQPYNRILHDSIKIQGKPLNQDRVYKVGFRGFIAEGGDGNLLLKDCPYTEQIMFKPMFMIMKQILEVGERKLQGFIYNEMLSDIIDNGKQVVQLDLSKVNIPSPIKLLSEIKQDKESKEQL